MSVFNTITISNWCQFKNEKDSKKVQNIFYYASIIQWLREQVWSWTVSLREIIQDSVSSFLKWRILLSTSIVRNNVFKFLAQCMAQILSLERATFHYKLVNGHSGLYMSYVIIRMSSFCHREFHSLQTAENTSTYNCQIWDLVLHCGDFTKFMLSSKTLGSQPAGSPH